jgi:ABC-type sugar transport system ATPase subunit
MPAVQLLDLHKRFDNGAVALAGVSLDVEAGELLVLLGPSGCGKSTVLRCIAGLEQPTSGRILVDGADVTDLPPQSRDVAMVFQSYALYPHMTVAENIGFPLRMRGRPKDEVARRVREAAATLGLEPLLDRRPAQLSGGERQRVALGRAIVREPRVFLFDEPLSNLDARLRAAMRAELLALHQSLGRAMVFVTHDQVEAMTMGRRIAVLRDGVVQQIGTPKEMYQRPANVFVAQFVGSPGMNVIDGPTDRRTDGPRLGFRPEDAILVAPEDGRWRGTVRLVEPLGAETLVHLVVDGGNAVVVRLRGGDAPPLGAELGVHVEDARLHRFASDGTRFA